MRGGLRRGGGGVEDGRRKRRLYDGLEWSHSERHTHDMVLADDFGKSVYTLYVETGRGGIGWQDAHTAAMKWRNTGIGTEM